MKIPALLAITIVFFVNPVYSQVAMGSEHQVIEGKVPNINSKADDHSPFLSRNGLTLYFTSNRFGKSHIYSSKRKDMNSPWSEPQYCKLTSNPQDYVSGISFDGIGKFYFESNREAYIKGDINIWEGFGLDSGTTIRALPDPVNTIKWEGQPSVTREGNDIYFVSNRGSPAGSVEMLYDIYVTHRKSDGSWTDPQNLGSQVNIGIYNTTPFITPDGRFLFYASKEKKGTEIKRKIYMAEHTGPMDRDWSKPVLLPPPINSDKDDLCPMVASDGRTIYFSSNREGGSGFDIYQAELPQKIQALIAESFINK